MLRPTHIMAFLILTSCSDTQHQAGTDSSVPKNELDAATISENDTHQMALIKAQYDKPDSSYVDYWCSTDILRKTNSKIDKLDLVLVADFLATFHESCNSNVEYTEWSNELLFEVIKRRPDRVLELMNKNSSLSRDYILNELSSPIHDQIDIDEIIDAMKGLNKSHSVEWQLKIIDALEKAKAKN